MPSRTIATEIERYLRTGDADVMGYAWPDAIIERGRRQRADLRGALVEEVRRLAKGRTHQIVPARAGDSPGFRSSGESCRVSRASAL